MTEPNVDALREKLRGLGYLDAGVDRFVLGPARAGLGSWGIAWRASVRLGALGAALVGVPAAVAMALRLPALVTGVRDTFVLTAYALAAAGVATALVTLAVTLAAARLAAVRRGRPGFAARARRVSQAAGAFVALGCLLYLTLWWRVISTPTAAAPPPALWVSGLVLLLAAVVSVLLGHTTTIVALAVLAGTDTGERMGRLAPASWGTRALLAILAVAGSAALLAVTYPRAPGPSPDAPALVVVPTGLRLLVIGVDGFDPAFAARLAREGRVPTLARAMAAPHAMLPRGRGLDPVAAWMSIATAQPPERHGATALASRRVAGIGGRLAGEPSGIGELLAATTDLLRLTRPVISTGSERREMTFWEVAARAGLRTAAVNWWTTWPAAPRDGIVVSDRAAVRLEVGGTLQAEIAPAALYDTLRAAWPAMHARAQRDAAAVAARASEPLEEAVRRAADVDALQCELVHALDGARLDLLTVYLPGLDIGQVALLGAPPEAGPSGIASRIDALALLYEGLDARVAELIADAPAHSLVLVTHPGRLGGDRPAMLAVSTTPGTDDGAREAAAAASRGGQDARLEDVGATVLDLLGVPLSRELAGRVRTELLPAALQARAGRRVERYAAREAASGRAEGTGQALDEEVLERLRSLGYVR